MQHADVAVMHDGALATWSSLFLAGAIVLVLACGFGLAEWWARRSER